MTVWERMWYYSFTLHPDLDPIPPPHEGDAFMLSWFLGQSSETRISLNHCRISHMMFWQSDIVTANVHQIDKGYLLPATDEVEADNSWFIFGRDQPTDKD